VTEMMIAGRFLHFTSAMLLFGAPAFRMALVGWAPAWVLAGLDVRLRRPLVATAMVALVSAVLVLAVETANMAGRWTAAIDLNVLGTVLGETAFGAVWRWRLLLALGVLVAAIIVRGGTRVMLLVLSASFLGSLALTGHAAADEGAIGVIRRANQAVHLFASGLWLGGLLALAIALSLSSGRAHAATADRILRRFSDLGAVGVALILLSGIVNSWFSVGGWSDLLGTSYGRALTIKVVLVAGMIALAIVNRIVLLPTYQREPHLASRRLSSNIVLELVLGTLVILVASVLGTLPPAGHGATE
jgi:putative copper resistance protein D